MDRIDQAIHDGVRGEHKNSAENSHFLPADASQKSYEAIISQVINQGKLPEEGLPPQQIEALINRLSMIDSNNWKNLVPVGEREGRVYSSLVKTRNYNLSHGIGRSGNLTNLQPKARGSSLIYSLARSLVSDAFVQAGLKKSAKNPKNLILMPVATGMSLNFCFSALRKAAAAAAKEDQENPDTIIWSRIDQGSCVKSMLAGNFKVKVVALREKSGESATFSDQVDKGLHDGAKIGSLYNNYNDIEAALKEVGRKALCVHITTSCFAPREPDNWDGGK